jgi:predicted restriction endonuclease
VPLADGKPSPIDANCVADLDEDAEKEILAEGIALSQLQETEQQAIVAARRGQGRFRQALFDFWHGCAVTGCTRTGVLKASHLKPWRLSTNEERLDKFNGLLLTPNLDAALDRCLIAFDNDGKILISPVFSSNDLQSLGLYPQMRLRRLDRHHLPYLAFHRHLFENRAKALIKREVTRIRKLVDEPV